MDFKQIVAEEISNITGIPAKDIYSTIEIPPNPQMGDFAFPCFSLAKTMKKAPQQIAMEIAVKLSSNQTNQNSKSKIIESALATGPYVNFKIRKDILATQILGNIKEGRIFKQSNSEIILVESPSPNTNKPIHLGHVRNILLGKSLSNVLKKLGHKVVATDTVNDRGVHICKSMLAYKLYGLPEKKTPKSENRKSDFFVGDYYVKFAKEAEKNPKLEEQAQELLLLWEKGDKKTVALWKKMRKWCLDGFKKTYKSYGLTIDKAYFESEIYKEGKKIVEEGLAQGLFKRDETGAIYADLESKGLGKKILMRKDGTSIYITQDIYLAKKRYEDFKMNRMIYVVGNEQIHHFKVLFELFNMLNYSFAKNCYHLSYGMIELPEGKMKSREGNVVDADNIRTEMIELAEEEVNNRYPKLAKSAKKKRAQAIGMGALKFFILKNSSARDFVYNPKESISFQGETGPYVQYTHARICSVIKKASSESNLGVENFNSEFLKHPLERELIIELGNFEDVLKSSAQNYDSSEIANYLIKLSQLFNKYYHEVQIISDDVEVTSSKLYLLNKVKIILSEGLSLLDIEAPNEM